MEKFAVYIGDVALDEYYKADHWPGVKEKALVDVLPAIPGGMIANAACVAARLGTKVKFITALNSRPISQYLLNDLREYDIDTSLVQFDESLADSKTMIFLTGNEHTILIPRLGLTKIVLSDECLRELENATYIYSTPNDLALCRCAGYEGFELFQRLRGKGAKIVCDLDVDYVRDGNFDLYKFMDIVFLNEVGFESVQGMLSPQETVARMLESGVEVLVVTEAEKGCTVYTHEGSLHADGRKVEVVDVTGAGDTFCSSFLHALFQGKGLRYAADFANTAASICVGKLGARAGAVSQLEVEASLS